MTTNEIIIQNIRELMDEARKRGITQVVLAERGGFAQGQLSVWASKTTPPKPAGLAALARAFGLKTDDLLKPGAAKRAFGAGTEVDEEAAPEREISSLSPARRALLEVLAPLDDAQVSELLPDLRDYVAARIGLDSTPGAKKAK